VTAAARQRARRALLRLSLTEAQAEGARRVLRPEQRQVRAAQEALAECRRQLCQALASPAPDSAAVLELTVQERLLERRARELVLAAERSLAALLRPEQAVRLRALPPAALDDVLERICP
jgi:Spy/CpxP family protein refolding chaperone